MLQQGSITIRAEGGNVLLVFNNRAIKMPWEAALEVARHLAGKAREAEEFVKAESIIKDGAILDRLGIPFGLSSNPKIKVEVRKEAQWDSDLRKKIKGSRVPSVHSKEAFGTPLVKLGKKP